ncbi:hypothetical protein MYAM1_000156 [Malassezia yamatoensis]|uniref:Golgi apparatus membrane protein TVP38 n=1 Tax=Malassezia yamatoensis TaxID=253288 RepID=A0AAJ5YNA9_9BASI|nr:hypothetical protein MYAM1_000156 [Malassezia yamatoensis]
MSRPPSQMSVNRVPTDTTAVGRSTSTPQRIRPKQLRSLSLEANDEQSAPRLQQDQGMDHSRATVPASPTQLAHERSWSPTRALSRGAAFAAQSIVDVLTRSLSPTLHAATLFDSPTISSPSQAAAYNEVFGTRSESPETIIQPGKSSRTGFQQRPLGRGSETIWHAHDVSSRARGTPDSIRQRMTPAGDAQRHRATSDLNPNRQRTRTESRSGHDPTFTEELNPLAFIPHLSNHNPIADRPRPPRIQTRSRTPSPNLTEEHAIPMHSTIVAPQARRGAVYLRSRRRARRAKNMQRPSLIRNLVNALCTLAHPRQFAACVRQSSSSQWQYWNEAFRDKDTGLRCWNPPWIHAYIPLLIWFLITISSTIIVFMFRAAVFRALDSMSVALRRCGLAGRVVFGLIIFLTTFPPLPLYSTLVILSGFAFGMWEGFVVSYIAALLGSITVFTLSRTYLHGWMTKLLKASGGLSRVVRAIEKRPRLLFLVRLAPYPFNLLNTLLASSNVLQLRTYVICTGLALPKLMVHTALGSSLQSFAHYHTPDTTSGTNHGESQSAPSHQPSTRMERMKRGASYFGIALCIGSFVYLYHLTSRAVDDLEDKSENEASDVQLEEEMDLLSDELEDNDKEFPDTKLTTHPGHSWAGNAEPMTNIQRRSATPVTMPEIASSGRESCTVYAPSPFLPSNDLTRAGSMRNSHHRSSLSIAEQIARMEHAAENH